MFDINEFADNLEAVDLDFEYLDESTDVELLSDDEILNGE